MKGAAIPSCLPSLYFLVTMRCSWIGQEAKSITGTEAWKVGVGAKHINQTPGMVTDCDCGCILSFRVFSCVPDAAVNISSRVRANQAGPTENSMAFNVLPLLIHYST